MYRSHTARSIGLDGKFDFHSNMKKNPGLTDGSLHCQHHRGISDRRIPPVAVRHGARSRSPVTAERSCGRVVTRMKQTWLTASDVPTSPRTERPCHALHGHHQGQSESAIPAMNAFRPATCPGFAIIATSPDSLWRLPSPAAELSI